MKYLLTICIIFLIISCQKDDNDNDFVDYSQKNENDIINYIKTHDLDATRSSSGLYYVIEEEGEGIQASSNSTVTVNYKGYYLNGTIFDESNEEGITFNLQQVIEGWTEGITYFKEGGNGILLVPSKLGYGSFDYNGIPAGSVLIFDIELLAVL